MVRPFERCHKKAYPELSENVRFYLGKLTTQTDENRVFVVKRGDNRTIYENQKIIYKK